MAASAQISLVGRPSPTLPHGRTDGNERGTERKDRREGERDKKPRDVMRVDGEEEGPRNRCKEAYSHV